MLFVGFAGKVFVAAKISSKFKEIFTRGRKLCVLWLVDGLLLNFCIFAAGRLSGMDDPHWSCSRQAAHFHQHNPLLASRPHTIVQKASKVVE